MIVRGPLSEINNVIILAKNQQFLGCFVCTSPLLNLILAGVIDHTATYLLYSNNKVKIFFVVNKGPFALKCKL